LSRIAKLLRSNEKILWQGKPVLIPFILGGYHNIPIIFGLFFIAAILFTFIIPIASYGRHFNIMLFVLIPFFIVFAFAFDTIILFLSYKNTEYAITNQRLITQTGAIGLDTRYVDLEKIQEVNVNIGFIDKLFGTGNIFAPSASQASIGAIVTDSRFSYTQIIYRPNLAALKEPYKVQKLLQEAMKEVKLSSS